MIYATRLWFLLLLLLLLLLSFLLAVAWGVGRGAPPQRFQRRKLYWA